MFLVRAGAALSKAEEQLRDAVAQFEKDLNLDQQKTLLAYRPQAHQSPPDFSDVMRTTAEIYREVSKTKCFRGRCLGSRFTNVLQSVQQFAALEDVIIGGSQNLIACGVWSLVRSSLLLMANFSACVEKLSKLLMDVGRAAPRYQEMSLLYPQSQSLRSNMCEYFTVVVRLCHQIVMFTKQSIFQQLRSFLSGQQMNSFRRELDHRSIDEHGSRLKVFIKSEKTRWREKVKLKILNYYSTYDYQSTWKELRKAGNTIRLQRSTEYHSWKTAQQSLTLICQGKLGSGKSVVLANMVANLGLYVRSAMCPVAYFFCRHNVHESLKFLTRVTDFTVIERLILEDYPPNPGLDFDMPFSKSRSIHTQFPNLHRLSTHDNTADIANFIDDELEKLIKAHKLRLTDPILVLEIADALLKDAQSIFLWAALQIAALILDRATGKVEGYQTCVLKVLTATYRPLTTEELREALNVTPGNSVWNSEQLITSFMVDEESLTARSMVEILSTKVAPQLLTAAFPSKVIYSMNLPQAVGDLAVRLLRSRKQPNFDMGKLLNWIEHTKNDSTDDSNIIQLLVLVAEWEAILDKNMNLLDWALMHNHGLILRASIGEKDRNNLLEAIKKESTDKLAELLPKSMLFDACSYGKVNIARLLVKARADIHLTETESGETPLPGVAKGCFFNGANIEAKNHDGSTPLMNAVKSGRFEMISFLVKKRAEVRVGLDNQDITGRTPLSYAASDGGVDIVKLLLEAEASPNIKDHENRTPLVYAAVNKGMAVIELLLHTGNDPEVAEDNGSTALSYACSAGEVGIVKLLLAAGANPNSKTILHRRDSHGRIAIWYAAGEGTLSIVKLLHDAGSDLISVDNAINMGCSHEAAARLLLSTGALVLSKDNFG
ncbi:hypothetical protein QBC36DRAFT_341991 [Triangularia setosa]|uniref:Nephrocystin 3-like N-terminal domain-containing protein n=1 Tax=Triangularia setosa TaxID=2587417 RepID=A0AAN6WK87_9PEZI|nr:hypothetical protein QBC36DRAFT_341991 [Podospora setosa]